MDTQHIRKLKLCNTENLHLPLMEKPRFETLNSLLNALRFYNPAILPAESFERIDREVYSQTAVMDDTEVSIVINLICEISVVV